jgi:gamma-glutamyl-gamma-aminobutyrate hydrolase PuuD
MEIASYRFLVAVQWHPENLFLAGDLHAQGLFGGFIEAC